MRFLAYKLYRFTKLEGNRQYLYKMGKSEKKKVVLEKTWLSFHFPLTEAAKFFKLRAKRKCSCEF